MKPDIAQFGSVVYEISPRITLSDPRRPRLSFIEYESSNLNDDDESSSYGSENDESEDDEGLDRCYEGNFNANNNVGRSKWPRAEELPCVKGSRFEIIIKRCWTRAYQRVNEVLKDLADYEQFGSARAQTTG